MIYIWSSWCHCHPIISCSSKIQNGLPLWCWLTYVVLEKTDVVVVVVQTLNKQQQDIEQSSLERDTQQNGRKKGSRSGGNRSRRQFAGWQVCSKEFLLKIFASQFQRFPDTAVEQSMLQGRKDIWRKITLFKAMDTWRQKKTGRTSSRFLRYVMGCRGFSWTSSSL